MKYIHINCDLGEGGETDALLMPLISACNIACGGHAGTLDSMQHTVDLALEHGVEIGAHPSYPDKENFGRKSIGMSDAELKRSVVAQILGLKQIAEAAGGLLRHVKPHGALYNDAFRDERVAGIIVESLLEFEDPLQLYVPPGSVIEDLAQGHINVKYEAFGDRTYNKDFSLVSRKEPNSLITRKEDVFQQLLSLFLDQEMPCSSGEKMPCRADTFCLHSDTPNAEEILEYLHRKFQERNVKIKNT